MMLSRTPAENCEKGIGGPLSLFVSDDLWETLEATRNINSYTKFKNDASEAVLRTTPYAINTTPLNKDTKDDFIKRGELLAQVYELLCLRRIYGVNGIGDDVPQKSTVVGTKFDAKDAVFMRMVLEENKQNLYSTNREDGEIKMNGEKARKLVQSMTWSRFANLDWKAEEIKKYRGGDMDLRDFVKGYHAEIGTKMMGFDPDKLDDHELLQILYQQSPKLKLLCKMVLEVVYERKTKMTCWLEYLGSRFFWRWCCHS